MTRRRQTRRLVVGALLVLIACAVVGAGLWLSVAPDLAQRGKAAMRAGRAFGAQHDAAGCLEEAVRRTPNLGLIEEAENKSFLDACLRAAPPTRAACDGAPRIGDASSSAWASRACADQRAPDLERCIRLIGAWQRACERTTRADR